MLKDDRAAWSLPDQAEENPDRTDYYLIKSAKVVLLISKGDLRSVAKGIIDKDEWFRLEQKRIGSLG